MGSTSTATRFGNSRYWVSGYPKLVEEWDHERNGVLTPDRVRAGSARRIWWRCARGFDHVWRAKPNNRTSGSGCPYCANKRVSVTNSLERCFPLIAREWHEDLNGKLGAEGVVATSARIAWWRCAAVPNHEWRASIRDRTRYQTACPFCSHRRVSPEASLAEVHPKLRDEWDRERNGPLTPEDVLPGSSRIVWWRCRENPSHGWRAAVVNRTSLASGCPDCARRRNTADTSHG
jgi:hypothetical protein